MAFKGKARPQVYGGGCLPHSALLVDYGNRFLHASAWCVYVCLVISIRLCVWPGSLLSFRFPASFFIGFQKVPWITVPPRLKDRPGNRFFTAVVGPLQIVGVHFGYDRAGVPGKLLYFPHGLPGHQCQGYGRVP